MATDVQAAEAQPIAVPAPTGPDRSLFDVRHRISVEQYHRMGESGVFRSGEPIELLEGLLVRKMTKKPPHVIATELIPLTIIPMLPDGWYLSSQNPVTIAESDSEPEPDVKIVRGHPRDYRERRVGPVDSPLVIEVADSSYRYDRGAKLIVYARALVPVYWILDLNRRVLEVFTDPTGPTEPAYYRTCRTFGPDDEAGIVLDGREVGRFAVRAILP